MDLNAAILHAWELDELSDGLLKQLQATAVAESLAIENLPKATGLILYHHQDVPCATRLMSAYAARYGASSAFLEAQARIFAHEGYLTKAIELFQEACRSDAHDFISWTLLGSLLLENGNVNGIQEIADLAAHRASAAELGFLVMIIALLMGEPMKIRAMVQHWLQLPCQRLVYVLSFAEHLHDAGERHLAEIVWNGVRNKRAMQARLYRALLLSEVEPAKSQRIAQELVQEFPGRYLNHFVLATAYWHDRRYDLAALHFKRAMRLAPWDESSKLFYGASILKLGKTEAAHQIALDLTDMLPEWWQAHSLMASVYEKQGRRAEAAAAQARSRELRDGSRR